MKWSKKFPVTRFYTKIVDLIISDDVPDRRGGGGMKRKYISGPT